MSSILALPAPSSLPSSSTYGRARALLASEAPPVTPVRQIPDEQQQRRQQSNQTTDAVGASPSDDTGVVGNGRRRAATNFNAGENNDGGNRNAARPADALRTQDPGPTSGFVTQSLYQEAMGSGLHIEPWAQALGAYRRADAAGAQSGGLAVVV